MVTVYYNESIQIKRSQHGAQKQEAESRGVLHADLPVALPSGVVDSAFSKNDVRQYTWCIASQRSLPELWEIYFNP